MNIGQGLELGRRHVVKNLQEATDPGELVLWDRVWQSKQNSCSLLTQGIPMDGLRVFQTKTLRFKKADLSHGTL